MPNQTESPFAASYRSVAIARIEFDYFKERAREKIEKFANGQDRFRLLSKYFAHHIHIDADTVQVDFGKRPLGRTTYDGKPASEKGPSLVYSLGPTGFISTTLMPATSEVATVFEEAIHIRIGRFGGPYLLDRIEADLAKLVAYLDVTSIDTHPTLRERLLISYLRFAQPTQVDKKFVPGKLQGHVRSATYSVCRKLFDAAMKPLPAIILAYVLLWLQLPYLADLVKGKESCGASSAASTQVR